MDRQVTELVGEQQKALNILKENEAKLHESAEYLCRHEAITGKEFTDILERKPLPQEAKKADPRLLKNRRGIFTNP